MRIVLTFVPLLLCAGTMFVCLRMMAGKHASGSPDHSVMDTPRQNQPASLDAQPIQASDES